MNNLWVRVGIITSAALFLTACPEAPGGGAGPKPDKIDEPNEGSTGGETSSGGEETSTNTEVTDFDLNHFPAGDLIAGSTSVQGDIGVETDLDIAPGMRFPIENGPAFPNSQIFGRGGGGYIDNRWPAVGGSENDAENFDYPWRDNFCEVRLSTSKHTNPLCPSGLGHQGQDIRAASCANAVHWAVAPEEVVVRNVANLHLINLYGLETGTMYTMMHMQRPFAELVDADGNSMGRTIQRGDTIPRGARIGRISDVITQPDPTADTACARAGRCTTVHLHFEIRAGVSPNGSIASGKAINAVSPYNSLVNSYLRLAQASGDDFAGPVTQPPLSACLSPQ